MPRRRSADALAANPANADRKIYFAGHWGFQHYMQQRGATALDKRRTKLAVGDVVVLPDNNTALIGLPPGAARVAATLRAGADAARLDHAPCRPARGFTAMCGARCRSRSATCRRSGTR